MSDRYNVKKLRKETAAARALAAAYDRPAAGELPRPVPVEPQELLCRAHGQPWRSCAACSTKKGT